MFDPSTFFVSHLNDISFSLVCVQSVQKQRNARMSLDQAVFLVNENVNVGTITSSVHSRDATTFFLQNSFFLFYERKKNSI